MQLSRGGALSAGSSTVAQRPAQKRAHAAIRGRTAQDAAACCSSRHPTAAAAPAHEACTASTSRRGTLLGLAGVLAAGVALQGRPAQAAAAAPTATASDAGNKALVSYMELESAGKLKDKKSLDDFRSRYGIKRGVDGRVSIQGGSGDWYSVRLDMEVAGAMLLRHEKSGKVYAIETDGLSQVDLSDDYILLMMFADGQWETEMAPIEFEDERSGSTDQLKMQEREFREFVGLLKELEEAEAAGSGDKKKK